MLHPINRKEVVSLDEVDIRIQGEDTLSKVKEEESSIKKMYEFVSKDGTIIRCKNKERLLQYKNYFKK